MDIEYDSERRILRVTPQGRWPNGAGHAGARAKVASLDVPPDAGALIDLRQVDAATAPRFTQIAFRSERAMSGLPARRAYLVNDGVQFGVARMIQSMASEEVQVEVFTDETRALAWLANAPDE